MAPRGPFISFHEIFATSLRVVLPPNAGEELHGSGFVWKEGKVSFLVTCKHLLFGKDFVENPSMVSYLELNFLVYGNPVNGLLPEPETPSPLNPKKCRITLSPNDKRILKHADKTVDVVLVDLSECDLKDSFVYSFSKRNLPGPDLNIGPGDPLIVVGYPLDFWDNFTNLPLARSASLASAWGLPYKEKQIFLTDAVLHGGMSGSPIIFDPKFLITRRGIKLRTGRPLVILGMHSGKDPTLFSESDINLNKSWPPLHILNILQTNGRIQDHYD